MSTVPGKSDGGGAPDPGVPTANQDNLTSEQLIR
jgi:hypothetical protein